MSVTKEESSRCWHACLCSGKVWMSPSFQFEKQEGVVTDLVLMGLVSVNAGMLAIGGLLSITTLVANMAIHS